jgi:hypothetical protein
MWVIYRYSDLFRGFPEVFKPDLSCTPFLKLYSSKNVSFPVPEIIWYDQGGWLFSRTFAFNGLVKALLPEGDPARIAEGVFHQEPPPELLKELKEAGLKVCLVEKFGAALDRLTRHS